MKLYVPEKGAAHVRGLRDIVVSQLMRVEVPSALWRKARTGELGGAQVEILVDRLGFDLDGWAGTPPRFAVVSVTDELLDHAVASIRRHALRAYDAVQLASAMAAREADASCSEFVCFDDQLSAAASAEGFIAIP